MRQNFLWHQTCSLDLTPKNLPQFLPKPPQIRVGITKCVLAQRHRYSSQECGEHGDPPVFASETFSWSFSCCRLKPGRGGGTSALLYYPSSDLSFLLRQVACGDKMAFRGRCHTISYIRSLHPISPEKQPGAITNDTSIYTDAGGPGRKNARKNAKVAKRQTILQSVSRFRCDVSIHNAVN